MFTPKQFARLNHFAHLQNARNCQTLESCTEVQRIEAMRDGTLLCSLATDDVDKGIFHTFAVIAIGPRGGLKVISTRHDVF